MNLDYNGVPQQEFKRELRDRFNSLGSDAVVFTEQVTEDEATLTFKSVSKVFIKGSKLKKALGDLNPAAFIPVTESSPVRSSLERLGEDPNKITFGLYKTAIDFILGRSDALDEAFLTTIIKNTDPQDAGVKVTTTHKNIGNSNKDWLTEFLVKFSPVAGLTIAGFLNDLAFSRALKVPVPDGPVAGTQPAAYHLQGIYIAISLLIEAGMTLAGLKILTEPFSGNNNDAIANAYNELNGNPIKRKEVLDAAGYDYDALCKNKKFDDYLAIKEYCLTYISKLIDDVQYDHWIAYANVGDNQGALKSALALAPMYSKKWKLFQDTGDVSVLETSYSVDDIDSEINLEEAVASGLNKGLRDYFGSLLQVSDDHYNKTLQVYSMQIDERMLCCILWFIGPLDTEFLVKLSNILHILSARTSVDWKSLLSRLGEGVARSVANMMLSYVGMFIEKVFNDVLTQLFKIPGADLDVAFKKCIGIELIFNLIESAWIGVFMESIELVKKLQGMIDELKIKGTASVEIAAERRYLVALSGLLRAVADKIELAKQSCTFEEGLPSSELNDIAAEAAVQFIIENSNNINYPTIELSDDLRRKFFKDVPNFTTSSLKLPVPGLDESGHTQSLSTQDNIIECGANGRAREGLEIGQKIANILNSK